ncbi:MAG: glycoside hydrolase family 99-like domain-containing protein [Lachnospiraceae bacterium]|nr:glycoside hydrolase family 99-like domain-containing protein [Lachnospiraceae bacterium]
MKPKIITFYLPQFHTTPENDKWWGKGFTDWVSARNAEKLFPRHYQPRLPAHDHYYNLLDKETMCRQARLAKKAGIYGFCIYHYWFGNDKQLLEKPAENLLEWEDIDINYCFSWANESWVRSWSKFDGNAWMATEDKAEEELNQGILVQQEYGDEREWKKHFDYLLPFFRDKRYIKKDDKPVFVIYKPENIKRIRLIVQYWNLLAREQGFPGIYFIGTNDSRWKKDGLNAELLYEPQFTFGDRPSVVMMKMQKVLKRNNIHFLQLYSYDKFWKKILNRKVKEKTYYGGFVDYDDTPRKGVDGIVINGMTPYKFGKYFRQLYNKAADRGDEYVFLTAWNEWGEGAYLEPDQRYGMRCLWELGQIVKENRHT